MKRAKTGIDKVEQRTRRYWYIDGLVEMAMGCVLALMGLLFLAEDLTPPGSVLGLIATFSFPVLLPIAAGAVYYLVKVMKARLTYPRTGYVSYRHPSAMRRWVAVFIGTGVGLLASILVAEELASSVWLSTFQGLLVGAGLLGLGYALGLTHFYGLALISVLAGAAASLSGLENLPGRGAHLSAVGVALLVSGGLTLRNYLRQTQPPAEEE